MSEFKYVPIEPTEEMIEAGCKAGWFGFKAAIKAELAADPAHPSPAESDNAAAEIGKSIK